MGPSLLEERVTNSSLIEVSESLIPYDFRRASLSLLVERIVTDLTLLLKEKDCRPERTEDNVALKQ